MDPFSAFAGLGLACNIIQLVEVAIKLAKECKEISATGSTRDILTTTELSDLVTKISNASSTFLPITSPGNAIDTQIQECATRSLQAASDLGTLARDITHRKDKTERTLMEKGFRSLRNRSKIEAQRRKLVELQSTLQTSLLNGIRGDIRDSGALTAVQLTAVNTSIDAVIDGNKAATAQLLHAIEDIRKLYRIELAQMSQSINAQTMSTQKAITTHLASVDNHISASEAIVIDQLKVLNLDDRQRHALERLYNILYYDSMHERENSIRARVNDYGETAKWLFGDFGSVGGQDSQGHPIMNDMQGHRRHAVYKSFETWIRTGSGIWFVEGKPGCGKSSLMSFIRQNLEEGGRARRLVSEWAEGKPCRILSFFFFRPATSRLDRSFEGVWRSLCAQLLSMDESLVQHVLDDSRTPQGIRAATSKDRIAKPIWRSDDFRSWFNYMLSQTSGCVIILLDGLDEFQEFEGGDEGHGALLATIQTLSTDHSHVKLICSSRPVEPFKSAFRTNSSFRLQDVNDTDISKFTFSTLHGTQAFEFARDVANRANGIFLWAHIVAHDLAKAARRGAGRIELTERLDHCPVEMRDLFRHMVARQDHFYRSKPLPILYLIDICTQLPRGAQRGITLFELLLLTCGDYSVDKLLKPMRNAFSEDFVGAITTRAAGFADEVVDRCGGLVIVRPCTFNPTTTLSYAFNHFVRRSKSDHQSLWTLLDQEVTFVHRTAHDFLLEEGASFLSLSAASMKRSYGLALLALASIGFMSLDDTCFADTENVNVSDMLSDFISGLNYALQDPDRTDECCAIADLCVQRLATRLPLKDFGRQKLRWWPRDIHIEPPTCSALPLDVQIAVKICWPDVRIVRHWLLPRIQRVEGTLKPVAAAYAFVCISEQQALESLFDLLALTNPCTILSLTDVENEDASRQTQDHPFWEHFFAYGIFSLLAEDSLRARALETARSYFNQGVGEHETCTRRIMMRREGNYRSLRIGPTPSSTKISG
ncbi:uncharacterized protein AB675_1627 [Cyphellophora attinorum]|uniref:Nephrocystin 3-like N-terminal domain-containing protein n=1 Tax=Cyphellophora attinorum TaxID=1664694 RepID=A0A0N1GYR5_9EURO|nr:uncharacterized protein AB675_1627 [Phialophora attinorum]KPI36006.1 hypothetical protein AB675_1627 [Phialophora attinorum]